jgi:hypothetical protein
MKSRADYDADLTQPDLEEAKQDAEQGDRDVAPGRAGAAPGLLHDGELRFEVSLVGG